MNSVNVRMTQAWRSYRDAKGDEAARDVLRKMAGVDDLSDVAPDQMRDVIQACAPAGSLDDLAPRAWAKWNGREK